MLKGFTSVVRSFIYDRNGEVLVRNRPSYQIALVSMNMPRHKAERDTLFKRLLGIREASGERLFDSLSLDTAFLRSRWIKNRPIRLLEDASPEQVAIIEEHSEELPGIVRKSMKKTNMRMIIIFLKG